MWWITPLRRWISSPGKNSTGYDYGQISGCFQPLTHPFREGIFTFLEGFFLPKSRWFLFFFNSCKGQKFYFKWIVFHQISSPQWLKYWMIFPTWEFHSETLIPCTSLVSTYYPICHSVRRDVWQTAQDFCEAPILLAGIFFLPNFNSSSSHSSLSVNSLAGMIHKVGLLPKCNSQPVPLAYKMLFFHYTSARLPTPEMHAASRAWF